ncbi:hypothetical protein H9Q69_011430 [Fusarium xylarioides]|uniref:Chromo domain-containing protein n=1 Tax=Fusarium xylarioides TaxID=221167 RepID=A0A9P7HUL6_9HYPO|nr:hypothetical protein H9Q72_006062 [Fusarium xylarioides]KAG5789506.1 hypothetical protein H9Q69_011430 [Fusarium xylarioides]
MEGASNAPENSSRPEITPASSQPRNRPSNSAAGSSSRQSEMNRLIGDLANKFGYHDGDGPRSRENSLRPSARRSATPTPTPAQSVELSWKYSGGREATGGFLFHLANREMDRRRESQPNPTYISEERFPIEEFLGWRIYDEDSVVINVRWADGSPDTEEPEEIMHIDSAPTLLNFWRRQGGRGWATGLREHRILRVLKSKKPRKDRGSELLLCQWIGLPASDRYTTWMSEEEVQARALGQWLEFKTGVNNIFG